MANKEHLELLKSGVEKWNAWRWREGRWVSRVDLTGATLGEADLSEANLSEVDLRGANLFSATLSGATFTLGKLDGADFSGADLSRADFRMTTVSEATLRLATLSCANLSGAYLSRTDLGGAYLVGANLDNADLSGADLSGANLDAATLSGANLFGANLLGANLLGASLLGANLGSTSLGSLDLSGSHGLMEVTHRNPSQISTSTLEHTARGLTTAPPERQGEVETFLRGAGVTEHFVEYFRSLIGQPIEFYSAFISYSHADKAFARRLYNDLQAKGIRCWLDEKDGRIGDPIYEAVNRAIRANDRVILCCSFASLTSKWVDKELTMTFDKEDRSGQPILLPLDLDGALFEWTSAKAVMVRERIAARFKGWDTDARLYEERLERVVEAMRPREDRDGE